MAGDLIAHARARRAELQVLRAEPRYKRVMGFLVAKGLLTAPNIPCKPSVKVPLSDALWVGETLEPRVLEVLPAALLHFPKSFIIGRKLPEDLARTLAALKRGDATCEPFRGVPYERVARWTAQPLQDRRTRPLRERRVARTFRIRPALLSQLVERAVKTQSTQTDILEQALEHSLSR